MKKKLRAPWLKYYGTRKKSLRYPNVSMYQLFRERAVKFSKNDAYEFFGTTVTYKQMLIKVDRAARALASYNVKKGDTVTIISANVPEALIAIYATNRVGAIANIVHPLSSEADIKLALNLTGSRMLFVMDIAYETAAKVIPETDVRDVVILSAKDSLFGFMYFGYMLTQGRKIPKIPNTPRNFTYRDFLSQAHNVTRDVTVKTGIDDPAVILYSGGTTGRPKGILLSNGAFNASVLQVKNFIPSTCAPGSSILGFLPIFHGLGLSVCIHSMLCNGVKILLLPKFDANQLPRLLATKHPNIVPGVPALFQQFLSNPKLAKLDYSNIELLACGGDAISNSTKQTVDRFFREHGCHTEIVQGYGLTEFLAGVCFSPPERVKLGSIGIPLADIYMKIVEPNTDITKPTGEIGEIVITGPNIMLGYVNEPEETARTLIKHSDGRIWLHTGDLGHMDDEGYFFFDARLKRMIISNGYNIYPSHIEEVIATVDEVLTCTVVGVPHKTRGEAAKAFVVLNEGKHANKALERKIMEQCRANLPKYSLPSKIEFRDALPKTKLNKVAFTELK